MGQSSESIPDPVEWRAPVRALARLATGTIQRLSSASLPPSADAAVATEVGLGVSRKVSLMPVHVSLVVLTLTCAFALAASLRSGRRVSRVPEDVISRQIANWSRSRLPLARDTMLLYARLARFVYYARSESS